MSRSQRLNNPPTPSLLQLIGEAQEGLELTVGLFLEHTDFSSTHQRTVGGRKVKATMSLKISLSYADHLQKGRC